MRVDSQHVEWARRIQALAQIGLEYAENSYDRERYEALRKVAAEMTAAASDVPQHQWQALFEREAGYATPKIDVRGAVFRDGQVLLSRELDDGRWSLPGGWADVNDPPSAAVIRELREETGYEVRCSKLAAVLDRDLHYSDDRHPFHIYKLMFLCEIIGKAGALDHDISEARFFPVNELPPLSLHRTLPEQIALMYEHDQDPVLPTVFD
jgi:ADP-ribose pyrophosphatase YjhB (NUDIX family)